MKNTLLLALGLSAAAAAITPAIGQVYQWKDENGRTVVSDTPPPGKYKATRSSGGTAAPVENTPSASGTPTSAPAAAPKSTAEKEMEYKKRQQESREKAEKEAKEQTLAAERKDNCNRAQQALRTLESNQRIATTNAKGEREILDEKQRQEEAERARKAVAESCK